MAGLVTRATNRSVKKFIDNIENDARRDDAKTLLKIFKEASKMKATVWGNEKVPDFLIGFGKYTYSRKGNSEVFEWFKVGFAPRKNNLTIYLMLDLKKEALLNQLGKYKAGSGCLYINKLSDVDIPTFKQMLTRSLSFNAKMT